jgi:lysophospholipase L1-like esterase
MITSRESPRARTVGFGSKVAASAAAVALALGLCEIGVRLILPAPPDPTREPQILYQSQPDVGFLHVPNQMGWLDDGLATINALGLRGVLPEIPKPADSVRVLAIGDSTTFGWGVGDRETYPAQLESLLKRDFPSRRVSVVNGGVGAYNLKHEARLLRHFGPILTPDIVLVGMYWNDLPYERMDPDGEPQPARLAASEPAQSAATVSKPFHIGNQPSTLNLVLRKSRLLYTLRQAWLSAVAPTEKATNLVRWEMALLEGRHSRAIDAGWQELGATLREIALFGEAAGFEVGVVIIPIRAQVEGDYPQVEYQTRVRAMAEEVGVFVVDPLPLLMQQADRASLFIPYDRMHLSARGNLLVAEAAFALLRDRPEFGGARGR